MPKVAPFFSHPISYAACIDFSTAGLEKTDVGSWLGGLVYPDGGSSFMLKNSNLYRLTILIDDGKNLLHILLTIQQAIIQN